MVLIYDYSSISVQITCTIDGSTLASGNLQDPGSVTAGTSVTINCQPGWLWSDNTNNRIVQCSISGTWNVDFITDTCSSSFNYIQYLGVCLYFFFCVNRKRGILISIFKNSELNSNHISSLFRLCSYM